MKPHDHNGPGHNGRDHSQSEPEEAPAAPNAGARGARATALAVSGMDCADEGKLLNETLPRSHRPS